eukprot:scaffold20047_cov22-Tisochrysis_lutea.AAC.4
MRVITLGPRDCITLIAYLSASACRSCSLLAASSLARAASFALRCSGVSRVLINSPWVTDAPYWGSEKGLEMWTLSFGT